MSRLLNLKRGLATGYGTMAANLVFTLATVPLSLQYLSKAEFALWALILQVAGYLALVDFGIGTSVQRILADYKDDRDGGKYGSVLKTGQFIFLLQGLALGSAGIILGGTLAWLLELDASMQETFKVLLAGQCLLMAAGCWGKIVSAPFWCHQRYDVVNNSSSLSFLVNYAVLWFCYRAGFGLKSFLIANAVAVAFALIWHALAGWALGLFPRRGAWGKIDRTIFWELFHFGRDVFLMAIGSQLLSASQIIIITRTLGLEAAAVWSICTKAFTLAQQMVTKLFEFSAGGFTEMIVRGEADRLRHRFPEVVALTAGVSVVVGIVGAAANQSFVAVWTNGRFSWALANDALMALFAMIYAVVRCHTGLVGLTKDLRALRYVYFLEGASFFALAWWWATYFQFAGVIAAGIVATVVWSGFYGLQRSRNFFEVGYRELFACLLPAGRLMALLAPTAFFLWMATQGFPDLSRFFVLVVVLGLGGGALLLRFGLPETLRKEALRFILWKKSARA